MRASLITLIAVLLFPLILEASEVLDFSGTWETTYGTMFLQQDDPWWPTADDGFAVPLFVPA